MELVKPGLTYDKNLEDDGEGKYVYSDSTPQETDNTKIVRFVTPVDATQHLDLFTLTSDGVEQRKLVFGDYDVYLRDPNGHVVCIGKKYCSEVDGSIKLEAQMLYQDYHLTADKEGYDILIDFKTNKESENYQSASFTYTVAPVIREFVFSDYKSQGVEALSSGSFETLSGATINDGDTLIFKANVKDQTFTTTATAVGTDTTSTVAFKLSILDNKDEPISFGTDASFNVLRDNDAGTEKSDDAKRYKYTDPSLLLVDTTEPDPLTIKQYIGLLSKEANKTPNLTFTTVYKGPTTTFTKAQLALTIN